MAARKDTTSVASSPNQFPDGWDHTLGMVVTPTTQILDADGRDWAWAYVVFRPVPGFPAYCVGSDGSCWSRYLPRKSRLLDRWRRMRPHVTVDGYHIISLLSGPQQRAGRRVHTLILDAFVGPRPAGTEACHFPDRGRGNNRLRNLMWGTRQTNVDHQTIHGTLAVGERRRSAKLNADRIASMVEDRRSGMKMRQLAEKYGVSRHTVAHVLYGKSWSHLSFDRLPKPRSVFADESLAAAVREVRASGASYAQISRDFGISDGIVRRFLVGIERKKNMLAQPQPAGR